MTFYFISRARFSLSVLFDQPLDSLRASQVALVVKNPSANVGDRQARDVGSVPGSGRSPAGGHGNPLQYSCLENPLDRGAWQAIVDGVTRSWTQQSDLVQHTQHRV